MDKINELQVDIVKNLFVHYVSLFCGEVVEEKEEVRGAL